MTPALRGASQPLGLHQGQGATIVQGADAPQLIRQFGSPRLDIHEGDARKLQWIGSGCVLDAVLYPQAGRSTVTWYEARRSDGAPADRDACAARLRH